MLLRWAVVIGLLCGCGGCQSQGQVDVDARADKADAKDPTDPPPDGPPGALADVVWETDVPVMAERNYHLHIDGTLLFCGMIPSDSGAREPALVRIEPVSGAVETMPIEYGKTILGNGCQLTTAGDRRVAVWLDSKGGFYHWTSLTADGRQIVADHKLVAPRWFTTAASLDGKVAVMSGEGWNLDRYLMFTVSPDDGEVERYFLPSHPGEAPSDFGAAVATDGESLYTFIAPESFGFTHRVQKLAPLPE